MDTELRTELDIKTFDFPPKLAVSATLDGEKGDFRIFIAEGNALASYTYPNRKIIVRDGEIRLFEDDKLILSEPGPIDMSHITPGGYMGEDGIWVNTPPYYWYRLHKSGISTRAGSIYRLEVEIDGYETVTSTMTMPAAPVVSATMDTSIIFTKNFDYGYGSYEVKFWPVSVHLTAPDPNVHNYLALDIIDYNKEEGMENYYGNLQIGVSDISILQDNPDLEAQQGVLVSSEDFYLLNHLIVSNIAFAKKDAPLTFYSMVANTSASRINNPYYVDNPDFEKVKYRHEVFLRIRHFSESTFRYYRGQTLQNNNRADFFTEPVTITGNIENGYGHFAVINAVSIPFLEYEYEDWRWIGEQ